MPRRTDSISRHLGAVVIAALLTAGAVVAVVRQAGDVSLDLAAAPGAAWLSGEARGQVVLGSSGSELASLAVELSQKATQLTVIDTGASVFVYDASAQKVNRLDATDGSTKDTVGAPTPAVGKPAIMHAGAYVYVFDATKRTVQRISDSGVKDPPVEIDGFDSAVGTNDGRLWLAVKATGEVTTVDGSRSRTSRPTPAGADVELTAVGSDPVLVDRTNNRLRWLRRNTSVSPGFDLREATVQLPSPRATCLAVQFGSMLHCVSPGNDSLDVQLGAQPPVGSLLMANDRAAAFVRQGDTAVVIADWETGRVQHLTRPSPSTRAPVLAAAIGPLLIDDPGSAYALTVSGDRLTPLDKFNRRTLLLGADGEVVESAISRTRARGTTTGAADPRAIPDSRNDPPQPTPDIAVTRSGRSVSIPVLSNDTDPDDDLLGVVEAGPISNDKGRLSVSDLQRVVYSPPDGFVGQIQFPYQITDPGNLRASSTITVKVIDLQGNTAPNPTPDDVETSSNVHVVIDALGNDIDAEEDPLTITKLGAPTNGTAATLDHGRVRYEPKPGFVGNDEFTYTVADGFGGEASSTIRVRVYATDGSNRAPEPHDDRANIAAGKNTTLHLIENDTDPDGDPLRIEAVSDVPGLALTIVNGRTVDAIADDKLSGPVQFTYTVEDSAGLRATARVLLLVASHKTNGPPVAVDDRVVVPSAATFIDVVANDTDPDGDPLTVVGFEPPAVGTLTRISPTTFRFVPVSAQRGTVQFTYTVSDPEGLTASAKVIIEIIAAVASDPVAVDDVAEIQPGQSATIAVLANDSHPDRLPISIVGEPLVTAGRAVVQANQTILFTPPGPELATYVFTYTIGDPNGRTSSAKVSVKVVARQANRPPVARLDQADTAFSTSVRLSVLSNDTDPDNDELRIKDVDVAVGGTAIHDGTSVTFTPANGFAGIAQGVYTVVDTAGLTATGHFIVQVSARPKQAPVTNDDFATSFGGAVVIVAPLANDSDPDGAASQLSLVSVSAPTGVTTTINGDQVAIDPPSATGTYPVRYVVRDSDGLTAEGTIQVVVADPPNQPPVAVHDAVSVAFGTPINIQVLTNDTDPDGGLVAITQAGPVTAGGTASIVPGTGTIRFTPNTGFSGVITFPYTIRDAGGLTATATVTVTVEACAAPPPQLANDTVTTRFQTPVVVSVFANDIASAGTMTLGGTTAGTAVVVGVGQIEYRPATSFNGNASFTYSVTNACGAVATATVSVTVNRPPVAKNDEATTSKNAPVVIAVLNNDTDPDGDALTIAAIVGGVHGTATILGSAVQFVPEPGYVGVASFGYTIGDVGGLASTATVTVAVARGNDPPTAHPDVASTIAGNSIVIPVLGNDTDPDNDPLVITGVGVPTIGTAIIQGNAILFNPGATAGTAVFGYSIGDGRGGNASGSVTVTISSPNRPPVATPDTAQVTLGGAVDIAVLANDSDPDNDAIFLDAVDPIPGVSISGNVIHFVPTATGITNFQYSIRDSRGATATSSVSVLVSAPVTTTSGPPPT